jgi:hypothetical protein
LCTGPALAFLLLFGSVGGMRRFTFIYLVSMMLAGVTVLGGGVFLARYHPAYGEERGAAEELSAVYTHPELGFSFRFVQRPCRSPSSAVGGGRYATALASSAAGSDRGGAPPGVDAMDRGGWGGDNHAATGQMALPAQLGQLSRLVNITSQSRQNNASASLIGSWHNIVSDSMGCSMAPPPWVISEEAGGAVTPRAGPMSYVRCTVPISRGKTDATGSSRAESHAHRAEGDGGRHRPRGPRAAAQAGRALRCAARNMVEVHDTSHLTRVRMRRLLSHPVDAGIRSPTGSDRRAWSPPRERPVPPPFQGLPLHAGVE